jgi:CBS domain containing-hemolysin-like protein
MTTLDKIVMIPSSATVGELRFLLSQKYVPYIPIFNKQHQNIIAIAYPRDMLRLSDQKKVRDHARSVWFITEGTSVLQILKQFRKNNQSIAVVLDDSGLAVGILTLDDIIDTIFGRVDHWLSTADIAPRAHQIMVDRSFPGDMTLHEFNHTFKVHLEYKEAETLAQVVSLALGHPPSKGESVRVDQFELTVDETNLLTAKTVSVKTVF